MNQNDREALIEDAVEGLENYRSTGSHDAYREARAALDSLAVFEMTKAHASSAEHPAHRGHRYGGAYARAAALAAGDPDWINAVGGESQGEPSDAQTIRDAAHRLLGDVNPKHRPALTSLMSEDVRIVATAALRAAAAAGGEGR